MNHPSLYGALLSAFVHYAVLTMRSPLDNDWKHENVSEDIIIKLKTAAAYVVFNKS